MSLHTNNFRYTLTSRRGVKYVYPLGESDFTIQWAKQTDGKSYYKKTLPSQMILNGDAFDTILKIEQSKYRCEYMNILVERRCTTNNIETFIPAYAGKILCNDGAFDLDRKSVSIKIPEVDYYSCFENNNSVDINILSQIFNKQAISAYAPNITFEYLDQQSTYLNTQGGRCVDYVWNGTGQPQDAGWVVYKQFVRTDYLPQSPINPYTCYVTTSYVRQKMTLACSDPDPDNTWIPLLNTCGGLEPPYQRIYVRPATVSNLVIVNDTPDLPGNDYNYTSTWTVDGADQTATTIPNGMAIGDVINIFLNTYCYPIILKSDFFQINPYVESTINYVTGQPSKTSNVYFFQKSDVKRPTDSEAATIAQLNFTDCLSIITTMWNLSWRIFFDDILNSLVFQIEHYKYWDVPTIGMDLTTDRYAKFLNKLNRYSYDTQSIPPQETFEWEEASSPDFVGYPIVYVDCISQDNQANPIDHSLSQVTTDVAYVMANPDSNSSLVADDGFCVIACAKYQDGSFYIITEPAIFGSMALNNTLAWAQLHRDYWVYGRPVKHGALNGVLQDFLSVKPTRKGDKITVPFCCDDDFNPDLKVLTPLGVGTVNNAIFSFRDASMTFELLYDATINLTQNAPPVANNFTFDLYQPNYIDLDVFEHCSDPDGDDTLTSVVIQTPPTNGTAVVRPGGIIRYTPNPGFSGNDNITYVVMDDWSEPSNNALIAGVIHGVNQAPVAGNISFTADKNTQLNQPANGAFGNSSDDVSYTLQSYDHISTKGSPVVLNADGSFTYTPPANYLGADTFTFTIVDGQGLTGTGTVTINIVDPNAPVANPDVYGTRRGNSKTIATPGLLANDTGGTSVLSIVPENKATTQGGTVTINGDGSFTYNPPAGFIGVDTFTYTLSNGTETTTGNVTMHVWPDIYVKFVQSNIINTDQSQNCAGSPTYSGFTTTANYDLSFFSDSAGTVPFNVSGINFAVSITEALQISTGFGAGPGTPEYNALGIGCGGTVTNYLTDGITHVERLDCSSNRVRYEDYAYSLAVSDDYFNL